MVGACRCVFRVDHVAQPVGIAQPECVHQPVKFCVTVAEPVGIRITIIAVSSAGRWVGRRHRGKKRSWADHIYCWGCICQPVGIYQPVKFHISIN